MTEPRTANAWHWGGTDMTPTPHLSMAERIRVAEFDAAPEPPEIVVERVAWAMKLWDGTTSSESADEWFRGLARAAIAALDPS